jgi:hypothetical protein
MLIIINILVSASAAILAAVAVVNLFRGVKVRQQEGHRITEQSSSRGSKNSRNISIVIILIALSFSSLSLILSLSNFKYSNFDSGGFVVGVFAILVTTLIGFQIYNAFEINKKVDGCKSDVKGVVDSNKAFHYEFNKQTDEFREEVDKIFEITRCELIAAIETELSDVMARKKDFNAVQIKCNIEVLYAVYILRTRHNWNDYDELYERSFNAIHVVFDDINESNPDYILSFKVGKIDSLLSCLDKIKDGPRVNRVRDFLMQQRVKKSEEQNKG